MCWRGLSLVRPGAAFCLVGGGWPVSLAYLLPLILLFLEIQLSSLWLSKGTTGS